MKRITSSIPPALSKLCAIRAMSVASGSSGVASLSSWWATRLTAGNTVSPRWATLPSDFSAGIDARAKGPRLRVEALIAGA
jgi:hypothetical protein